MFGAKSADYHGSCSFLSPYLCWNVFFVFIYASAVQHTAETVWGKRIFQKSNFLM